MPSWDGSCNREDACTECPTIRNLVSRSVEGLIKHLSVNALKFNRLIIVPYDPKFSDRQVWANSADPDQTAPRGAV